MTKTLSHSPSQRTKHLARTLAGVAVTLCVAQAAQAQMMSDMMSPGTSYIGLTGGPSDFSRTKGGNSSFPNDDRSTAYSLSVGNYFINPNLGGEIGYTNFGSVSRGGGTTKAEGINFSLVGKLPLSETFNLLGKIGTTYSQTDVSANPASGGMATGNSNGFDWSYGIGAELVFSPQLSGVLQYDEHFMKFAGSSSERVSTTMIGARLRF
jgi:hypothetical protein